MRVLVIFTVPKAAKRPGLTQALGPTETMSNTQYAFLKKSDVPSRSLLQASIDALGYDLQLYPDLDLLHDSGFSPCVLHGTQDVGFELYSQDSTEVTNGDENLTSVAGQTDFCIAMVWGGNMKDLACVMVVSCALAKDFAAVVSYEGQHIQSVDDLLTQTPAIIQHAMGRP